MTEIPTPEQMAELIRPIWEAQLAQADQDLSAPPGYVELPNGNWASVQYVVDEIIRNGWVVPPKWFEPVTIQFNQRPVIND